MFLGLRSPQPGLSGALFLFLNKKKKKAGAEDGNSCPNLSTPT